ncbi:metallo-mystery pair system four-Cys motif protein [Colwellia sp. BRX10-3]|uniref:MbnP family copper-binding protein n=1 Tax=Colwellia sp. BRX10-3 TaxID=2759844 RepID=UPI0015F36985|nr:MbnP family copper-binding protein [Colwellia sp. BRX10-3]MBA6389542.1 metallo-mystery pair system four-Cys motif protein [Colwellia sp. BRX10-3]
MLSNKQYVYSAAFIIFLSVSGYFFSFTSSSNPQINVQLLWQNDVLDCQIPFDTGEVNKTWFIEQFQFFISDVQLGSDKTGWQKLNLAQNPFQAHDTVLLGTNCPSVKQQTGSIKNSNWIIELEPISGASINENSAIRFTLGVPFKVNHLNPISQKSPLNLPSMFWVWQTGHKFMRLELATNNEQWLFHLGSTGCKSASVMRAPEQGCRYPNTFYFDLPIAKGEGNQLVLNLDLAALLKNVDLTASSSCQSEQDQDSCQQLFKNLAFDNKTKGTTIVSSVFEAITIKSESEKKDVE